MNSQNLAKKQRSTRDVTVFAIFNQLNIQHKNRYLYTNHKSYYKGYFPATKDSSINNQCSHGYPHQPPITIISPSSDYQHPLWFQEGGEFMVPRYRPSHIPLIHRLIKCQVFLSPSQGCQRSYTLLNLQLGTSLAAGSHSWRSHLL